MSRKDLPNTKAPNFGDRVRETVMGYLGKGDPLDRGITLRDLIKSGFASLSSGNSNIAFSASGETLNLLPGGALAAKSVDLTPPPTPTGLIATPAITNVLIEHDTPAYTQGHGHLRTHLYGAKRAKDAPAPVFTDATELAQFTGTVFAYSTTPATTWHFWIKWETQDGVLSTNPGGGVNGVSCTTGQDVSLLLTALNNQITESQLYSALGSRINLVDGPAALSGSVSARVLNEANARSLATSALQSSVAAEVNARSVADSITGAAVAAVNTAAASSAAGLVSEASSRADANSIISSALNAVGVSAGAVSAGVATEQNQRASADSSAASLTTTLYATQANTLAAVQTEQQTRADADSARASLTQNLVSAAGTNAAAIQTEQQTRADADASQASQTSALASTFGASAAALTVEQQTRADANSAQAVQTQALAASVGSSSAGLIVESQSRATADSAQVSQTAALAATTGVNSAAIQTEQDARTTANSAQASQSQALAAVVGTNAAAIKNEQEARATDTSASASQTNTLAAAVGSSASALVVEQQVRSDASSSQASQITSLAATTGANAGLIQVESQARSNADSAQASQIASVTAFTATSAAAIKTEQQARADADSASASQITTLSSSVTNNYNTLTAAIQQEAYTRSTADDAEATARQTLAARVTNTETRVTATESAIVSESQSRAAADTAEASARQALYAQVNDSSTGLPATRSTLTTDYYTKSGTDSAISSATTTLSARLNRVVNVNIMSRGLNASAGAARVALEDGSVLGYAGRSYMVTVFNGSTGAFVSATTYDVFGDPAQATAMAAALNALDSSKVVVVSTNDEPQGNRLADGLDAAMYRCGASRFVFGNASTFKYRGAYILVGVPGIGEGAGIERYAGSSDNAADAYCEYQLQLINGRPVSLGGNPLTAAVQQEATARANADGTLFAQYTVKIDLNGYVTGFGLASTNVNGTPTSAFAIRADSFYIANPAGPGVAPAMPFVVQTTATTINGVDVPVGVYISDAFIQNGTITNAKIANLAVDDAKIVNLKADKITAGSIQTGQYIQSTNYSAGTSGWTINGNGTAEFGAASIRGQLTAGQIDTRGLSIKDANGNVILAAGTALDISKFGGSILNPPSNVANSNISITSSGALSGGGGGQVTIGGLGYSGDLAATKNQIFRQASAPTSGMSTNDLWFNTSSFATYYYDGSDWVLAGDRTSSNTAAAISGQGALATQNSVAIGSTVKFADGTTLNTADFVNRLSKVGTGNIGTFIDGAAITDAYIGNLNASKITAGSLSANQYIQSSNYAAGGNGFRISANGTAEFGQVTVRGTIEASSLKANTIMVATANITDNAVTLPLTYETPASPQFASVGPVLTYTFTQPAAGKIIAIWQAQATSMRWFRFRMYLDGPDNNYALKLQSSFDSYTGQTTNYYAYDAVPDTAYQIGNSRSGGVFDDAPMFMGFGNVSAGFHTIRVWLSEYGGGSINAGQKIIILGAQK